VTTAAEGPKSTLEAVTAALEPATPAETPAPLVNDEEREDEETGGEEGGETEATETPAAETPAAQPDTEADTKPAAAAATPGKDDKSVEAKPDTKPATDPKAEAKPPAKPMDPINDPIPNGVSDRTRERMTKLVDMVKERDTRLTQADELFQSIESTGVTPDNFASMLGYLRVVNNQSASPEELELALQLIQSEARGLALRLGKPVAGVDFLAEHQDLKDAVENGTMTAEHANELAVARTKTKHDGETRTAAASAAEQARQAQEAHRRGTAALNALGQELAKDPLYATKAPIVVATLRPVFKTLPPDKWAEAFRAAYNELKLSADVATGVAPSAAQPVAQTPKPQPLRPSSPAGNGTRAPSNTLDAINAALGSMGG
jgi:hypothetical protein